MAKKKTTRSKTTKVNWTTLKLKGKTFVCTGTLPVYLDRKRIHEVVEAEGGVVAKNVTVATDYLIVGEGRGSGPSAAEKKVAQLNLNKGTSIQIISWEELAHVLVPSRDEAFAMLRAGKKGKQRYRWLTQGFYLNGVGPSAPIDLSRTDLRGTDLSEMNLAPVTLDGADLRDANLARSVLPPTEGAKFDGAVLSGVAVGTLTDCTLKKADLSNARVGGGMHGYATLTRCNFTGATLKQARFRRGVAEDSVFKRADLQKAKMEKFSFQGADFTGADLTSAELPHCDLSNAKLARADLSDANLTSASLAGADLSKAKLRATNLAVADLTGAKVDGADFSDANISAAKLEKVATSKAKGLVASRAVAKGKIGPKVREFENAARKADHLETSVALETPKGRVGLRVKTHRGRAYVRTVMGDAEEFGGASFLAAGMLEVAKKWAHGKLCLDSIQVKAPKCPVKGKALKELAAAAWCEICGEEIVSAEDLAKQQKDEQVNQQQLRDNLVELLRSGTGGVKTWNAMSRVDRQRPGDYRQVDLSGAKLRGVHFEKLDFQEANLSGTVIVGAFLREGDFRKADFRRADLRQLKGRLTKYQDANFSGATLEGADLVCSDLRRANLQKTKLADADFGDADLRGADLTGADLRNAKFDQTKYDEQTKVSKNFVPPDGMLWKGPGDPPGLAKAIQRDLPKGPIDIEALMKRLSSAVDKPRLDKAVKMLKAERFELFVDIQEEHLVGVVKSQSDPDLVYSCRLTSDGNFSCCTQNLFPCGGLRGKLCKHLLVLIVGLANGGAVDPTTVDRWVTASRRRKPELDKDLMSETLLRYKGAEAGEIDWRPTETVPEDFYAY